MNFRSVLIVIITLVDRLITLALILADSQAANGSSRCIQSDVDPPWTQFLMPSLFPHVPPYLRFSQISECPLSIPNILRLEIPWWATIRRSDINNTHAVLNRTGFLVLNDTTQLRIFQSYDRYASSNIIADKINPKFTSEETKLRHLPNILQLDDKIRLSKNQKRMIKKFGHADFPFVIPTFSIPTELDEFLSFCKISRKSFWVQKPPNLSRAIGIRFFENCKNFSNTVSVVQQYIQKPLTYLGRKLEFRKYAIITGFDPFRIFVINNELMKISSKNYTEDSKSLLDICVHIPWSPRCVESSSEYQPKGVYASALKDHFKHYGVDLIRIRRQMNDAIIKTVLSAQASMTKAAYMTFQSTYNAYNFVAFDFFVDESGHLWLNEVNRNPGLQSSTGLGIQNIIAAHLTIAGYHLPSYLSLEAKKFVLESLPTDLGLVDPTFDKRLYKLEKEISPKECKYSGKPPKNISKVLQNLTSNEIRQLILAEDELNRLPGFIKRIFPSNSMTKYLKYIDYKPYYYWVFNAWEKSYGGNREAGITKLRAFARQRFHLLS